ncbi:uncharacterized metal-binding protein YceD (DUF177 family) [Rhodovulum iodosum]|uniref:Uncharacterized metal-binding protein YceD (DUF177 family) n=1 Tax=Rhodovulum iodosum TaxID=68291 RepID=A0ABV3XT06_9RHOB|nr:DUF177 domain-containing protein [Rhodovulum robiginosum]RSK39027.1 DUF177 domain-containing protein [Rhodovulum robiginosum]
MAELPHRVYPARLSQGKAHDFSIVPDAEARAALADRLGLSALRKLRFEGRLMPENRADWQLEGRLGATVVQPCTVTLDPVTTRIDETVVRRYRAGMAEPEGEEAEMPEDDTEEPLPEIIDLDRVMEEALALALPLYPRAEGADLGEAVFAAPGVAPMTDADAHPMAALAKLKRDKGS